MKLNKATECEIIHVKLDKNEHPIAWNNKKQELVECGMSEEDAEGFLFKTTFEMEVYYAPNQGLFLIESEAIESTPIFNPYDGTECEVEDE